ncbi:hypothetical protein EPI10_015657 [Gossypium australe]|uniref:DUF7745 domain-containing protein n=1 Tax=Gossypium australe TaxID=47621 RepID=A0A5B6VLI5_9ROSI|nr:hypothetical protein EPI10_015657 [Gossypium australe]
MPTVEEYTTLLHCSRIQVHKAYSRAANVSDFVKKLMNITGMTRIQEKSEGKCIPWVSLRDLILAHPDVKKKIVVFAFCIYGLVIFPKALRHIDEAVTDLVDRLEKGVTPVPAILAETFRSLNACRRIGEGSWMRTVVVGLVEKVSYRVFSDNYSPLKEIVATPRREDVSEESWMALLQNLQEEDIEWRAHWMIPDKILYQCGSFD